MMMIVINFNYGNYVRLTLDLPWGTFDAWTWGGGFSFSEQVFIGSMVGVAPYHLTRSTAF